MPGAAITWCPAYSAGPGPGVITSAWWPPAWKCPTNRVGDTVDRGQERFRNDCDAHTDTMSTPCVVGVPIWLPAGELMMKPTSGPVRGDLDLDQHPVVRQPADQHRRRRPDVAEPLAQ